MDALVTMSIDKQYSDIPDDSSAAIFTSGLLGDQYVGLQPGGSPDMFKDGDEFVLTQSSMQLEDLIGKFLVNGSPQKPANGSAAPDGSSRSTSSARSAAARRNGSAPSSARSSSSARAASTPTSAAG
jgi:ABC-type transporter Mla subunit MlaD